MIDTDLIAREVVGPGQPALDQIREAFGAGVIAADGTPVARNGSRGLLWAEPMVELERDGRRTAFGPISPGATDRLATAKLGLVDELLEGQTRVIFGNCGAYEPTDFEAYVAAGGYDTLDKGPKVGAAIPQPLKAADQNGTARDFASLTGKRGLILLFSALREAA